MGTRALVAVVAVVCLVRAGSAGPVPEDATAHVVSVRASLSAALSWLKGMNGADAVADAEALKAALHEVRSARTVLDAAIATMDAAFGPPHYAVQVTGKTWRQNTKAVMTRLGNGLPTRQSVPDGGWLSIETKATLEHVQQPMVAAKLRFTLRGLAGFQQEVHWERNGRDAVAGDSHRTVLRVWVPQERVADFWQKEADSDTLAQDVQVETVWARFADGTVHGRMPGGG